MRIVDVWGSQQDWQTFFDGRILPNLEAAGVTGQPDAQFHDVHRYFDVLSGRAGG
jgi:hypothetical protein